MLDAFKIGINNYRLILKTKRKKVNLVVIRYLVRFNFIARFELYPLEVHLFLRYNSFGYAVIKNFSYIKISERMYLSFRYMKNLIRTKFHFSPFVLLATPVGIVNTIEYLKYGIIGFPFGRIEI